MTELKNWSFMNINNPSDPTDWKRLQATGHIYGDPRFRDGDFVVTSDIISVNGRSIVTLSGTHYFLSGQSESAWKAWQKDYGKEIDDDNPLSGYAVKKPIINEE